MQKRILFITLRADYGGGPEHVYRLISGLSGNYKPFIACPDEEPYMEKYATLVGAENIYVLPHRKFSLRKLSGIIAFIVKNKISLIHSHGKGAGIYSRPSGLISHTPVVHSYHGVHIEKYSPLRRQLYIVTEQVLSMLTGRIIAVSKSERETMLKLQLAAGEKIHFIPNGVILPEKVNESARKNEYSVLCITRWDDVKNPRMIIDICESLYAMKKHLLEIYFDIVIGNEGAQTLLSQAKKQGVEKYVRFHAYVNNPEIYYRGADLYLSTSLREGLPLTLLEAMSYGIPVVASRVPGNSDIIIHRLNGYLYDVSDPESAADCIYSLFNSDGERSSIAEAGRNTVESEYSLTGMIDKTETLYKDVLG